MSEESSTVPSVPEPEESGLVPAEFLAGLIPPPPSALNSGPRFIAAGDLSEIITILVKADKITPDEAVRRLNNMVEKGTLVIVPMIGTKRR